MGIPGRLNNRTGAKPDACLQAMGVPLCIQSIEHVNALFSLIAESLSKK